MKDKIRELADYIIRMNQVILAFPVWLVLGFSGLLKTGSRSSGWEESEPHDRYEVRY